MTSLQKQMSKGILYIYHQLAKSDVTVQHIRNEARLKIINKESVNVDNDAHKEASIHLANVEKHIRAGGLLD